mgnify:CR=1 FL=1
MLKLIYGVAVNDLPDHRTQIVEYIVNENGKKKRKVVWQCPFYTKWFNMLTRCYNEVELKRHPTYEKNFVCRDWLLFSSFKSWMETQDWEEKQLDKDILSAGSLEYSPETCVFVSQEVNKFLLEKTAIRDLPIGVSYHKVKKKFIASISCGENGKIKQVGAFNCPEQAHLAWATEKLEMSKQIAQKQSDERIANALILRYTKIFEIAKLNAEG